MTDKTAIIIGASRGIGLGLAKELASRGYSVIASERSDSEELRAAAEAHKPAIEIVKCDVTDADSVAGLRGKCTEGSVDLLIMNAGVYGGSEQALDALTRDNVADIVMTNAVAPTQAALELLPLVKRGGTIGMMSSKMGSIDDSSGGTNLYRLSKVSQNMLARSLFAKHAEPCGVGVISLHPGWVQTDMGGPQAPLSVEESTEGLADVLESASGKGFRYADYKGDDLPF